MACLVQRDACFPCLACQSFFFSCEPLILSTAVRWSNLASFACHALKRTAHAEASLKVDSFMVCIVMYVEEN